MYRGDDQTLKIESDTSVTEASEVTFTVRRRLRDDSPVQFTKTLTAGEIVPGDEDTEADVSILSEDTAALEPGMYTWDLELVDAYGMIHTGALGRLHIRADVTHAEFS